MAVPRVLRKKLSDGKSRYLYRGKVAESRFEKQCLAEYAEVLKSVCVDAAHYKFPDRRYLEGMVSQVPPDFQFGFKVTDEITLKKFTNLPRHGLRAPNDNFLNADLLTSAFIRPFEEFRRNVRLLMFDFSRFYSRFGGGNRCPRVSHLYRKFPVPSACFGGLPGSASCGPYGTPRLKSRATGGHWDESEVSFSLKRWRHLVFNCRERSTSFPGRSFNASTLACQEEADPRQCSAPNHPAGLGQMKNLGLAPTRDRAFKNVVPVIRLQGKTDTKIAGASPRFVLVNYERGGKNLVIRDIHEGKRHPRPPPIKPRRLASFRIMDGAPNDRWLVYIKGFVQSGSPTLIAGIFSYAHLTPTVLEQRRRSVVVIRGKQFGRASNV
jgi:Protein of unknown function DUF72